MPCHRHSIHLLKIINLGKEKSWEKRKLGTCRVLTTIHEGGVTHFFFIDLKSGLRERVGSFTIGLNNFFAICSVTGSWLRIAVPRSYEAYISGS